MLISFFQIAKTDRRKMEAHTRLQYHLARPQIPKQMFC